MVDIRPNFINLIRDLFAHRKNNLKSFFTRYYQNIYHSTFFKRRFIFLVVLFLNSGSTLLWYFVEL